MDNASYDRSWPVAGSSPPSSSISFGMTLVMAIACGVAAANIYYNQPMLGIMEAAFPGQVTVIGLVPTATQLGFAAGLLLLVPLGDRFDRRRLILIQLAALTLSLAAAALAPGAWSLVVVRSMRPSSGLIEPIGSTNMDSSSLGPIGPWRSCAAIRATPRSFGR